MLARRSFIAALSLPASTLPCLRRRSSLQFDCPSLLPFVASRQTVIVKSVLTTSGALDPVSWLAQFVRLSRHRRDCNHDYHSSHHQEHTYLRCHSIMTLSHRTPTFPLWPSTAERRSSSRSPSHSPASSDCDTDDDEVAAGAWGRQHGAHHQSRSGRYRTSHSSSPLSLSIPQPSSPPTLEQVLSNAASPPYSLAAFMAYLSQNHCLESLEFTLDARRYRDSYAAVVRQRGGALPSESDCAVPQVQHLAMLWQRLLAAYILPAAPREINVSCEDRDALLEYSYAVMPPHPDVLEPAMRRILDLMQESIFLPFISSHHHCQQTPVHDDHRPSMHSYRPRRTHSYSSHHPSLTSGASTPSLTMTSSAASHSGSRPPALPSLCDGVAGFSDDTTSTSSSTPSSPGGADGGEPVTPPMTPPGMGAGMDMLVGGYGVNGPVCVGGTSASSPKSSRTERPWKKMGMRLGLKRRVE